MLYYFIIESHLRKNLAKYPVPYNMFEGGWGNGYVLIPEDHPFYGKDYDELDVWAHGGITLACKYSEFNIIRRSIDEGSEFQLDEKLKKRIDEDGHNFLDRYWVIGFDTAHYDDDLIKCSKDYVWKETKGLYKQCLERDIKIVRKNKLKKLEYEQQSKKC